MEIGSFIELQFDKGREYFKGEKNVARLNTGRSAIYHAFRLSKCNSIWLPIYQCDTVRDFLISKNVVIKYYHINQKFDPIDLNKSDSKNFVVSSEGHLIPPFRTIDGLGETVSKAIVLEREKRPFLSIEDLQIRAKISGTLIEKLRDMHILDGLPESSQLSLF